MRKRAIERVEAEHLVQERPDINVGDTVEVGVRIVEGEKQRIQVFGGTVIAMKGQGATATFTVRRIVAGEGVERTFPLHSPSLAFVRVVRSGEVRRAKLYYLRDRIGKATRLIERRRQVGTVSYREEEATPEETEEEAAKEEAAEDKAE